MPGGDRMGPRGEGPRTGRGRLNCTPDANATRPYFGRGFGVAGFRRGFGGAGYGRGYGFGYGYNNLNTANESVLENEKKALEERIKYIDSVLEK